MASPVRWPDFHVRGAGGDQRRTASVTDFADHDYERGVGDAKGTYRHAVGASIELDADAVLDEDAIE